MALLTLFEPTAMGMGYFSVFLVDVTEEIIYQYNEYHLESDGVECSKRIEKS